MPLQGLGLPIRHHSEKHEIPVRRGLDCASTYAFAITGDRMDTGTDDGTRGGKQFSSTPASATTP